MLALHWQRDSCTSAPLGPRQGRRNHDLPSAPHGKATWRWRTCEVFVVSMLLPGQTHFKGAQTTAGRGFHYMYWMQLFACALRTCALILDPSRSIYPAGDCRAECPSANHENTILLEARTLSIIWSTRVSDSMRAPSPLQSNHALFPAIAGPLIRTGLGDRPYHGVLSSVNTIVAANSMGGLVLGENYWVC